MKQNLHYPGPTRIRQAIIDVLYNFGGEASLGQVKERLNNVFADELTDEALSATENTRNGSRWVHTIRGAKQPLVDDGYLVPPSEIGRRGIWKLTSLGLSRATKTPDAGAIFPSVDIAEEDDFDDDDLIATEVDDAASLPATRQGFMASSAVRKAVEEHAVELARKYFASLGYAVETYGKPFDLLCSREEDTLYVEVKGTQGSGAEILLTRGEVNFHRNNPGKMALFVTSGIEVSSEGQASGGHSIIKMPWVIDVESLTPYIFTYKV
ncbi:MAG: DUF3883 domain-containing protein [Acidobacteria bacterium]|nr:DUF3883 domain-containing protein [Acidobacteriota bacterium]